MTGTETAPMIWSIMSGSLIRATPPSALMSAGTRSSAMTATAPASSAIFACSAVTTSMITPPLSMSAMPRLTRAVPVSGAFPVASPGWPAPGRLAGFPGLAAELMAGTMNLTRLLARSFHGRRSRRTGTAPRTPAQLAAWPSPAPAVPRPSPVPPFPGASASLSRRRVARREVRHVRAPPGGVPLHDGLVDLEELRQWGTTGQPEQPDQPPAARGAGGGDRVVVELAGQEHLVGGGLEFGERFVPAAPRGEVSAEPRLCERRPQGAGEVTFRPLVGLARGPRVVGGPSDQQARRRVEQAAGGQLDRDGAAPHQRRIERGPRGLHPGVQPVQPPGAPGHVHANQDRGDDDQDHAGQHR